MHFNNILDIEMIKMFLENKSSGKDKLKKGVKGKALIK